MAVATADQIRRDDVSVSFAMQVGSAAPAVGLPRNPMRSPSLRHVFMSAPPRLRMAMKLAYIMAYDRAAS